jgi:hypothetical protein
MPGENDWLHTQAYLFMSFSLLFAALALGFKEAGLTNSAEFVAPLALLWAVLGIAHLPPLYHLANDGLTRLLRSIHGTD